MLFARGFIMFLWLIVTHSVVQSQTYGTNLTHLYLMDFTPGACSATLIAPFTDSGTGGALQMGDLALCPDGILYGSSYSSTFNGLYEIDPTTGVSTLIVPVSGLYNALACSPDFRLFGVGGSTIAGGGEVVEFFVGSMTLSFIGDTGYTSAGDLVYYQGQWYNSVVGGLLEIPNIDAPGTNQLLYPGGTYQGVTVSPVTCNSLIVPASQYNEIDLTTGDLTPICNIGSICEEGLTSMFEFQPPVACPLILDLDEDDSSGLPDADYNGDMYTCATEGGLNISDQDVDISSFYDIVDITININMGLLDPPDEVLVLTTANNINISGSGTDQIILSNAGGATIDDFKTAISNIKYINQKPYPTPGVREIKVVFEDTEGALSNEAIGYITVTQYEDLIVDLGPDITVCEEEIVSLDAGPGDTYEWSNLENTQVISTSSAGIYSVTVTEDPKCPGIDTIEVIVLPNIEFYLDVEGPICNGEDFTIYVVTDYEGVFDIELENVNTSELYYFQDVMNGDILTISNIDNTFLQLTQIVLQVEDICPIDGSGLIDVIVNDAVVETLEATICQYDSILYRGEYLKEEGEYLDTVVSTFACDSLITFTLEVHPLYIDSITQFSCDPAAVGSFRDTLISIIGCDSIINLDINLLPTHDTTIVTTSCDILQVTDTILVLANQYGCDSTVHKIVNYALSDTLEVTTFTCNPAEVDTITQELVSVDGCDSIVINTTVLLSSDSTYIELYTCDLNAAGMVVNVEINMGGCDSLIFENYLYQEPSSEILQTIVCEPTSQGIQVDTLITSYGCDSIYITTEYIYSPPDTIKTNQFNCDLQVVGVNYNSLINVYGCDSIIEEVTILYQPLDTVYLEQSTCNSLLTGTNFNVYTTTDDCDSVVITEVIYNPLDTTYIFDTTCQLDSVGTKYFLFNTEEGCDSIVARSISFYPLDTTYNNIETCEISLSNTIDTIIFQTEGCDSIVLVTNNYIGSDTTFLSDVTCMDSEAGISIANLTNMHGCDSTIVNNIVLIPSDSMVITDTICYITNDSIEIISLSNQFGCDSIVTIKKVYDVPYLDLGLDQSIILGEEIFLDVNTSITDGELYWSSVPFMDSTEFSDLRIMPEEDITISLQILSIDGCEATDEINISVEKPITLVFPNVFSPNSDGVNDIYTFDLDDLSIETIESLIIIDRWGNKVYTIDNVNSMTPFGWDGTVNGQDVTSGVYIMFAKLRLSSGEHISIVQDLMVLR